MKLVQPLLPEETMAEPGRALAIAEATAQEVTALRKRWNDSAIFALHNPDTLEGLVNISPAE